MISLPNLNSVKAYTTNETRPIYTEDTGRYYRIVSKLETTSPGIQHNQSGFIIVEINEILPEVFGLNRSDFYFDTTFNRHFSTLTPDDVPSNKRDIILAKDFKESLLRFEPDEISYENTDLATLLEDGDYSDNGHTGSHPDSPEINKGCDLIHIKVRRYTVDGVDYVRQEIYEMDPDNSTTFCDMYHRVLVLDSNGNISALGRGKWFKTLVNETIPTSALELKDGHRPGDTNVSGGQTYEVVTLTDVKQGWYWLYGEANARLRTASPGLTYVSVYVNGELLKCIHGGSMDIFTFADSDGNIVSDWSDYSTNKIHAMVYIPNNNSTVKLRHYVEKNSRYNDDVNARCKLILQPLPFKTSTYFDL